MDFQRLLLVIALALVLLLLWQRWMDAYLVEEPTAERDTPAEVAEPELTPEEEVPEDVPLAPRPDPAERPAPEEPEATVPTEEPAEGERIRVETDLVRAEIELVGGDLRILDLMDYPVDVDQPDEPVRLMSDTGPHFYISQSGLVNAGAPDHRARYRAEADSYRLADGEDQLTIPLTWTNGEGLAVRKLLTFFRDSYEVEVRYEVTNEGAEPWEGRVYGQLQRTGDAPDTAWFLPTFMGAAIYNETDRFTKISFSDIEDQRLERRAQGGWAAMVQHYFVGAWIADPHAENYFYTRHVTPNRYVVGVMGPATQIAPGETGSLDLRLFAGPKEQGRLVDAAEGLRLTVDFGFLTILAQPLYWLLDNIHRIVGNWGWSIVILTLLIKLVFYKLSATSYRSMANMRRVAPRMQQIKEQYGDDKQKMNQAMMELYKREKINPLGGCLPILVQIPVFIALYWVLLESVELRHAPFMLWIQDLSTPDPYFILPAIMGASMLFQQYLNPAPMEKLQKRLMQVMIVTFTIFFAFFPAGLVLYWVVNNILSIAQQWYINHKMEQAPQTSS